jgi:hypothetical protein
VTQLLPCKFKSFLWCGHSTVNPTDVVLSKVAVSHECFADQFCSGVGCAVTFEGKNLSLRFSFWFNGFFWSDALLVFFFHQLNL